MKAMSYALSENKRKTRYIWCGAVVDYNADM